MSTDLSLIDPDEFQQRCISVGKKVERGEIKTLADVSTALGISEKFLGAIFVLLVLFIETPAEKPH